MTAFELSELEFSDLKAYLKVQAGYQRSVKDDLELHIRCGRITPEFGRRIAWLLDRMGILNEVLVVEHKREESVPSPNTPVDDKNKQVKLF